MRNVWLRLFPEEKELEKKQLKFLELCYTHGWNISSSARALSLNRRTVDKLIKELKEHPIYEEFCKQVEARLRDFYDRDFIRTLFHRYEEEYERLNAMIRAAERAGNDTKVLKLLQMKHSLMQTELRASLACQRMRLDSSAMESLEEKYGDLYREALDEFGIQEEIKTPAGNA